MTNDYLLLIVQICWSNCCAVASNRNYVKFTQAKFIIIRNDQDTNYNANS